MTYAEKTKVPADQSRSEIEKTVTKYGATAVAFLNQADRAMVIFEADDRRIRFDLPLIAARAGENESSRKSREQINRSRWRALLLCIKAKLEAVESKIETFEEAFMAHVVMPDGLTVADHIRPRIEEAYSSKQMVPLLPGPTSR